MTHCAPSRHWRREADGLLVINLESMWDDFAASVSCLVSHLEATPSEREIALNRYRERAMIVSPFAPHRASSPLTHRRQAAPGARAAVRPSVCCCLVRVSRTWVGRPSLVNNHKDHGPRHGARIITACREATRRATEDAFRAITRTRLSIALGQYQPPQRAVAITGRSPREAGTGSVRTCTPAAPGTLVNRLKRHPKRWVYERTY